MSIEDTLKARSDQHGVFEHNARITRQLMKTLSAGRRYVTLTPVQETALFFIMHKAARIVCGDPNYADHWHDIAGYAKLAEDLLG